MRLDGIRIAFLVTDGFEEVEYTEPREAVEKAGAQADLVAPRTGTVQAMNHHDKSDTYQVDRTVADADPADYDALVLPGGVANPDALRTDPQAVGFVRAFFGSGKPVGVICHGPWTMVEAPHPTVIKASLKSLERLERRFDQEGGGPVAVAVGAAAAVAAHAASSACLRATPSRPS